MPVLLVFHDFAVLLPDTASAKQRHTMARSAHENGPWTDWFPGA
jgi:hypothetical protein